ncbi:MAG: NlpC/P60 family protein [Psychromonas sp.]
MLSACSSYSGHHTAAVKPVPLENNKVLIEQNDEVPPEDLQSLLYNEFDSWKGTPYHFGGVNKSGVDCSALVQQIYLDSFNIKLPRTTYSQAKEGYAVNKSKLQIGDLIFFKTSSYAKHVGVFIGNNKFMHASTSKGVMISKLSNVYWRSKYWQSRRIIDQGNNQSMSL